MNNNNAREHTILGNTLLAVCFYQKRRIPARQGKQKNIPAKNATFDLTEIGLDCINSLLSFSLSLSLCLSP